MTRTIDFKYPNGHGLKITLEYTDGIPHYRFRRGSDVRTPEEIQFALDIAYDAMRRIERREKATKLDGVSYEFYIV